jgi:putative hydrolase of HD superfamily
VARSLQSITEKSLTDNRRNQLVLRTLPDRPPTNPASPLPFFHLLERLKTNKREGWRRFSIEHGESIADHMYRMSIITLLCPPALAARLDLHRCTKMALVHDMAEALVGDITPVDGVAKPEKSRREAETMDYLCGTLLGGVQGGLAGRDVRALWQEYEDSETLESHFVHDVDKMELLLQMLEYERAREGTLDLGEFSWVATRIVLPEVKAWAEELLKEREAFWARVSEAEGGATAKQSRAEDVSEEHKAMSREYYQGSGATVEEDAVPVLAS